MDKKAGNEFRSKIVFYLTAIALVLWAAYFCAMDWTLMEAQGLPGKMSSMPG